LKKFSRVSKVIGSAMKSVGEVMAIGRNFVEAFQKAVRMLDGSLDGFGHVPSQERDMNQEDLERELATPSDRRIFAIAAAFERGYSVDRIHALTFIDSFFLHKLKKIIEYQQFLKKQDSLWSAPKALIKRCKELGFSDRQIGRCTKSSEIEVRKLRIQLDIRPFVKQIDTLAAEFPAQTNYLYCTYNAIESDLSFHERGIMVLGCGAYRIGSSCEFDWCAVSCIRTLKSLGYKSIMVNFNPETVSTDYDECDRLYFEEITLERVLDIYEMEDSSGVIVSVGGQIPNNLVLPLHRQGVRVLGTHPNSIDSAEDRHKFSALLDSIGVDQPAWKQMTNLAEASAFADKVGYPVLVRPSYVLSGAAMSVAYDYKDLVKFISKAMDLNANGDVSVVISKFILGAKEIELDAVAKDGKIINYAISEHVENAGVHSGDASLVLPAQKLYVETIRLVKKAASKIASNLNISGPFNIQFLSKDNEIKVIECNVRASRSFPFVSKTFNVNFIELATKAMIGAPVKPSVIDLSDVAYTCIKVPMFSFTRLQGADPVLSVEMASTGEVACFGESRSEAYLLALISSGFKLPKKNILLSAGPWDAKHEFAPYARILVDLGFKLFASEGTATFLSQMSIPVETLYKPSSGKKPSILDALTTRKIDLVINFPEKMNPEELTDGYRIRRAAVDFSISLVTNLKSAILLVNSMQRIKNFRIRSWDEYLRSSKLLG